MNAKRSPVFNAALPGLLLIGLVCTPARHTLAGEDPASWDRAEALAYSQGALGRRVSGDYVLTRADGGRIRLQELRGEPLILSLIYTSCYHVCPMLTSSLARVVKVAREALGADSFSVVTVGFDSVNDTPERMRSFARARGISDPDWLFLSADQATVAALARDLGFIYFASPKGFDHLAQTTIVDADGRVYRQVYGADIEPPALVEPLKELVFGERRTDSGFGSWINGIKLFCTVYDPSSGRYRFDYSVFISGFVGLLSLGAIAYFIVVSWRGRRGA